MRLGFVSIVLKVVHLVPVILRARVTYISPGGTSIMPIRHELGSPYEEGTIRGTLRMLTR